MNNPLFDQVQSIDFLDIGCSGSLDGKWFSLLSLLSYTGFDPNAEECERLNSQPHSYKAARYLPYAIAGKKGTQTMYLTESIYCYSLLRPNHAWLSRLAHGHLFLEKGTDSVYCTTLNDLAIEEGLTADIIKLDTQGLELPILQAGEKVLEHAFCVETETGFVENYIGETTYAQIDEFMQSKGFLMFDLNIHRVSRKNTLAAYGKHQPIWCEALWFYDYIGRDKLPSTQEAALKAIMISKSLNFQDYALELSNYFQSKGLISSEHVETFNQPTLVSKKSKSKIGKILKLLPSSLHHRLLNGLTDILDVKEVLEKGF
jgi:FkbM family methyltransferase